MILILTCCVLVWWCIPSHFVEDWVRIGSPAKAKVEKEHASVPFDDQCSILEKVRAPYTHEQVVVARIG